MVEGLDEGMGGKRVEVGGREGRGKGEVGGEMGEWGDYYQVNHGREGGRGEGGGKVDYFFHLFLTFFLSFFFLLF